MLQNKEKYWISDDKWNLNQTNYLMHDWMPKTIFPSTINGEVILGNFDDAKADHILTTFSSKILLSTNDGEVILENFDDAKADQLIAAISSSGLKIIGSSEMETLHYENACVLTLKRKRR